MTSTEIMTLSKIKSTGATFTPKFLADFLSDEVLRKLETDIAVIAVLDPSCGDGELLMSIGQKLLDREIQFHLYGYDNDKGYAESASKRLAIFGLNNFTIVNGDFLETYSMKGHPNQGFKYDLIIANPPYIRTQILGAKKAQDLAEKFNLKGRVDLYYPFIIAMTHVLKENGIIGVITSNKFLSNKSGGSIREFLSLNYTIQKVIDLGDTKLFNAAVLPAIFIGVKEKGEKESSAEFVKLYEALEFTDEVVIKVEDVYEILHFPHAGNFQFGVKKFIKTKGHLTYSHTDSNWKMMDSTEEEWVSKIEKNSTWLIGDVFKVRVGIKSTCDTVFIKDNWDKLTVIPEERLLKNLISQENIRPWSATINNSLKILYPHEKIDGKRVPIDIKDYPLAQRYLTDHETLLASRTYVIEAGRKWYEIWVPHDPELWNKPKLVFPDISSQPRFYFDTQGKLVNGNCYWIVANNEEEAEMLLLIQGIANSAIMTKYHDLAFNNRLYSGRRRYITQYVSKYPMPDFHLGISKEIIHKVKDLNLETDLTRISSLEDQLEELVKQAYRLD